jgi:hypothetical protein
VMAVMMPGSAVPAMMAVMRGCWVRSLRLGRIHIFLWGGLACRSLPGQYKKH